MSRFRTLAAIFSPTYRSGLDDGVVLRAGGPLGAQVTVAPRGECAYRRLPMGHLRPRQRAAAARLATRRHEPVPGAPVHVAWHRGTAHAWWWIGARLPADAPPSAWLPESLLWPPLAGDGARLVRAMRGVEGQAWSDGELVSSQWWPQLPDARQWQQFLRGAGLPSAPVPEAIEPGTRPQPWGERPRGLAALPADQAERRAWQALAVVLCLVFGWQLAGLVHWSVVGARTASALESVRSSSTPLLAARDRAEGARAELAALAALQASVDDRALMVEIGRRLPEADAIASWVREGNRATVGLRATSMDPRTYVAALEDVPGIAELTASPEHGFMRLEFELAGAGDPGDPGDAAAALAAGGGR